MWEILLGRKNTVYFVFQTEISSGDIVRHIFLFALLEGSTCGWLSGGDVRLWMGIRRRIREKEEIWEWEKEEGEHHLMLRSDSWRHATSSIRTSFSYPLQFPSLNRFVYPICIVMLRTWPTRSHCLYYESSESSDSKAEWKRKGKTFLSGLIILLLFLTKFSLFSPLSLLILSFGSMPCYFYPHKLYFFSCDVRSMATEESVSWMRTRRERLQIHCIPFASLCSFHSPLLINNRENERFLSNWFRFMHLYKLDWHFFPLFIRCVDVTALCHKITQEAIFATLSNPLSLAFTRSNLVLCLNDNLFFSSSRHVQMLMFLVETDDESRTFSIPSFQINMMCLGIAIPSWKERRDDKRALKRCQTHLLVHWQCERAPGVI